MRHYTRGYLICSQQQKERKLQCITRRQNKLNEEDTQITNKLVSKRDVKKINFRVCAFSTVGSCNVSLETFVKHTSFEPGMQEMCKTLHNATDY